MEVRYLAHARQLSALEHIPRIAGEFAARFGRASGGLVRGYRTEGADTIVVALGSVLLYASVLIRQLFVAGLEGALAHVWDRDVLEFFLMGAALFGSGLTGEYIGRIYEQVRGRPRFLVQAVLESESGARPWKPKQSSLHTTT